MALETSYTARSAGSATASAQPEAKGDYWPLSKLRKCYTDYLFSKRQEIDEQIDARRYYHGSQWTAEQIAAMRRRRQPVMTFNRIQRKIDAITGLLERQRQDPKAYARTPQHDQGAELATATIRYVLDKHRWAEKSPIAAFTGAVDGIGGIELEITKGDRGDNEVGFDVVDISSFFYDPKSYRADFSDARYMGIGKWLDEDVAREMFPEAEDGVFEGNDTELVHPTDKEMRWFSVEGATKRIRVIDIWYSHKGKFCYSLFTGSGVLMEGASPFINENGKLTSKFEMYSAFVDQDGDRCGFIRHMKSAQDGINAKQSKLQHMIASNKIYVRQGMVDDIEKTRAENAKPDGVVVVNGAIDDSIKEADKSFDFTGLGELLKLNYEEIERFGPNPALVGDDQVENSSGRAIALLQQAGMAELGPYLLAYKGWKLRVYRAIWNAVQKHWSAERFIRVTDNDEIPQLVPINSLQNGEFGPQLVNVIGSLDVDIILDEGPDTITMAQDDQQTLQALGAGGVPVPPEVAVELSGLSPDRKRKVKEFYQQAAQQNPQIDPAQAKLKEVELNGQIKAAELEQNGQLKAKEIEQQAALKQQELAMQAQLKQQELNQKAEAQAQDQRLAQDKTASEMTMKREAHDGDMQIKRESHAMDVEKVRSESEAKAEPVAKITSELTGALSDMAKQIGEVIAQETEQIKLAVEGISEEIAAPAQIERDRSGRAVRVKKGSRTMAVQRDQDGRVAGLQ